MKNNKGFSLVELIIVIAIMAILVGVMAPQLIKYIEKSNVSADTQLCDSIHTAVVTAMMDPEVLADTAAATTISGLTGGSGKPVASFIGAPGGDKFLAAVGDILGVSASSELSLKSHGAGGTVLTDADVMVSISSNRCYVWIAGSDATGSKSASGTVISVY